MKIDGKLLAQDILHNLQKTIAQNHFTPHLAIILIGDNPASASYAKQKQKRAEEIGAKATIWNYESKITSQELFKKIQELNTDPTVHGIIVQRPLPERIDTQAINQAVVIQKDIDAFHEETLFGNPLVKAVWVILNFIYQKKNSTISLEEWLKEQNIVIIGKGETGGGPIIEYFTKQNILPTIIDKATINPIEYTKQADIIISAVGKKDIITQDMIKKGVTLISIGQHKDVDNKFYGDYTESDIQDMASFYTPTPGGVGPLTVACLLQNLVEATSS